MAMGTRQGDSISRSIPFHPLTRAAVGFGRSCLGTEFRRQMWKPDKWGQPERHQWKVNYFHTFRRDTILGVKNVYTGCLECDQCTGAPGLTFSSSHCNSCYDQKNTIAEIRRSCNCLISITEFPILARYLCIESGPGIYQLTIQDCIYIYVYRFRCKIQRRPILWTKRSTGKLDM